jgi:lipid II:glycine glycyltransferase (peptidoglycan interpeptide bridge formation enzyme)
MDASSIGLNGCGPMDVCEIDPLRDVRWPAFVRDHTAGSVFHTTGWLEALRRTYNYEPAALARCDSNDNLVSALLYCRVNSWLTGRRIVSLPFSDHCEPLAEDEDSLRRLVAGLRRRADASHCRYLELRPLSDLSEPIFGLAQGQRFYMHRLDLRAGADKIFQRFHRDCVQRKIRRAEREGLAHEASRSAATLEKFYDLVVQTRRRQGLPPQPIGWFRNLLECVGNAATIHLACKGERAVAGILTLEHGKCMVYKYGASDEHFHNLGGMPYLFWGAIQDAVDRRLEDLDLGRTDLDNPGLIAFKEHLGAQRSTVVYRRNPAANPTGAQKARTLQLFRLAFRIVPDSLLAATGSLLYRHSA